MPCRLDPVGKLQAGLDGPARPLEPPGADGPVGPQGLAPRAPASSPPRSSARTTRTRPSRTSRRRRASRAISPTGAPAPPSACALSPGSPSPARCWSSGASGAGRGSRGRRGRRAPPPRGPPPPWGGAPPACRRRRGAWRRPRRRPRRGAPGRGSCRRAPQLPGAGLAHAVAHQVRRAALPGGALEDLAHRPDEARVGVGHDEADAGDAAGPDPARELEPRVVGLGVDDRRPRDAPPAVLAAADRGHDGRGRHAALPPAPA